MALGYDKNLYILAFDHRGSFQKKFFGISGQPSPEETDRISDAKAAILHTPLDRVCAARAALIPREAARFALRVAGPHRSSGGRCLWRRALSSTVRHGCPIGDRRPS